MSTWNTSAMRFWMAVARACSATHASDIVHMSCFQVGWLHALMIGAEAVASKLSIAIRLQ